MKKLLLIASLLFGCTAANAQDDSTYTFNTGAARTFYHPVTVHYDSVVHDTLFDGLVSTDSAQIIARDSSYVLHLDSVRVDTAYFRPPSWLAIVPIMIMGTDSQAFILSVIPMEGDGVSYHVMRYHLYDNAGNELYSNRYRIDGSCYSAYLAQGMQYAYWKILNDPKTHLTKAD